MLQRKDLRLERLEDRDVPALFGLPWLDGQNVTVSFMPDNTVLDASKSVLFSKLAADGLTAAVVRSEILRAAQAWASQAGLNIGVVADNGSFAGSLGLAQGDTKFGDIRIGMRPIGDQVLALTSPPALFAETRSGDILLNSNYTYTVGKQGNKYDLYTVMLQEFGHALGVGNNTDTTSAMYEYYQGVRTGLSAADVTAVRSLYGSRVADASEGAGNNTRTSAAVLPAVAGTTTKYVRADLTTASDVDYYKFTTGSTAVAAAGVHLRAAGLSLLTGKLSLLSSSGTVLTTATAAGAGVNVSLSRNLTANTTYYVAVEKGSTANAVGAYKLSVVFDATATDPGVVAPTMTFTADAGTNDSWSTATVLTPAAGTTALRSYVVCAGLGTSADADFYRVQAPTLSTGQTATLVATVRGIPAAAPFLKFYDAAGVQLQALEVSTGGLSRVYQIQGVTSGKIVLVRAATDGMVANGNYKLDVMFLKQGLDMAVAQASTISAEENTKFLTLNLNRTQILAYNFQAVAQGNAAPSLVWIQLYENKTGRVVNTWINSPGRTSTMVMFLDPGEYTFKISATFQSGQMPVDYVLRLATITDPIGIQKIDPTTTGGTSSTTYEQPPMQFFTYDKAYYEWLLPTA